MSTEAAETADYSPGRFNTTRWSIVLSCADSGIESVAARDALSELCKTYWRPIFAYVCRRLDGNRPKPRMIVGPSWKGEADRDVVQHDPGAYVATLYGPA